MEHWKQEIHKSLITRNNQATQFIPIISNYISLIQLNTELSSQNVIRHHEVTLIQRTSCSKIESEELLSKIKAIESLLYEVYKSKTDNIEKILSLKEINQDLEQKLLNISEEIKEIDRNFKQINSHRNDLNELHSKLFVSHECLTSENNNLFNSVGSLLIDKEKLQLENSSLTSRMTEITEEKVNRQNEINELLQALKAKELAMNQYEQVKSEESNKKDQEVLQVYSNRGLRAPRKEMYLFKAHDLDGTTLTYNANGTLIISSGNENYLKVWDSYSATERLALKGYRQPIMCISVADTDDLIIAGSCNNSSYIWSSYNNKLKHTLNGHLGKINGVGFLRNGSQAISASEDKTIKLWDISKGFCTNTISTSSIIYSLALNPRDSTFLTGHKDGIVRMHSSKSHRAINIFTEGDSSVSCCTVSPCGNYLAVSTRNHKISIKDLRMLEIIQSLNHKNYQCPSATTSISISSDSKYISAGSFNGNIITWDLISGTAESIIQETSTKPIVAVCWSPNDSQICSIDTTGYIGIWI